MIVSEVGKIGRGCHTMNQVFLGLFYGLWISQSKLEVDVVGSVLDKSRLVPGRKSTTSAKPTSSSIILRLA